MIASFFQGLDRHGVEAMLINGQATVLYGAATFSEDIDLWINPTETNRKRFLAVLHEAQARYYKLTPPFTVEHLQRGHDFHFVLPGGDAGEIFLDVMGNPPRAGSFASVFPTARRMETDWGAILTIGIRPLVELKKPSGWRTIPSSGNSRSRGLISRSARLPPKISSGRCKTFSPCPNWRAFLPDTPSPSRSPRSSTLLWPSSDDNY